MGIVVNKTEFITSIENPQLLDMETNFMRTDIRNEANVSIRMLLKFRESTPDLFEFGPKEKMLLDVSDFVCRMYANSDSLITIKTPKRKLKVNAAYYDHYGQLWVRENDVFKLIFNGYF